MVAIATLAIVGILLTVAPSSTSAVEADRYLPSASVTMDYSCSGRDQQTDDILQAIGLDPFGMRTTVSSAEHPAPSNGEDFDLSFSWRLTISSAFVQTAVDLGETNFSMSSDQYPIVASSGATGSSPGTGAPLVDVPLGDGSVPIAYSRGPYSGTFNRTSPAGSQLAFRPQTVTLTMTTNSGVELLLSCTAGSGELTVVDAPAPEPTTTSTTVSRRERYASYNWHRLGVRDSAIKVMGLTMSKFREEADSPWHDSRLNWSTDLCSGPDGIEFIVGGIWWEKFWDSCTRHDFGYRNFGGTLRLDQTADRRTWVDGIFLLDMLNVCRKQNVVLRGSCRFSANAFYDAVHLTPWGHNAFFGSG